LSFFLHYSGSKYFATSEAASTIIFCSAVSSKSKSFTDQFLQGVDIKNCFSCTPQTIVSLPHFCFHAKRSQHAKGMRKNGRRPPPVISLCPFEMQFHRIAHFCRMGLLVGRMGSDSRSNLTNQHGSAPDNKQNAHSRVRVSLGLPFPYCNLCRSSAHAMLFWPSFLR
jgi:hypothetical protein